MAEVNQWAICLPGGAIACDADDGRLEIFGSKAKTETRLLYIEDDFNDRLHLECVEVTNRRQ